MRVITINETTVYQGQALYLFGHKLVFGERIIVPDDDCYMTPHYQSGRYSLEIHEATVEDVQQADFDQIAYRVDGAEMSITAVIPQYKTGLMIEDAVLSLLGFYPDLPVIVVDDGSNDDSTEVVKRLAEKHDNVQALILERNRGHGAALHAGLLLVQTRRVFTMDSDVFVRRGAFLEQMENRMVDADLYAIGWVYWRDYSHHNVYVSSIASLYDMERYRQLPPFHHHGDPMQQNLDAAQARGWKVEAFPMTAFLVHEECGTRRHFEYRWDLTHD
jgi:glycosyltransferase involved in cell wall biosynthesis